MKRSKGIRNNTRKLLKKSRTEKRKNIISRYLAKFNIGEKVVIKPEPSIQKTIPHRRFIGKIGKVIGERGKSYLVKIKDHNAYKTLIIKPVHLRRV